MTLDMNHMSLGVEDILISRFVIILALLEKQFGFVVLCCCVLDLVLYVSLSFVRFYELVLRPHGHPDKRHSRCWCWEGPHLPSGRNFVGSEPLTIVPKPAAHEQPRSDRITYQNVIAEVTHEPKPILQLCTHFNGVR